MISKDPNTDILRAWGWDMAQSSDHLAIDDVAEADQGPLKQSADTQRYCERRQGKAPVFIEEGQKSRNFKLLDI